MEPIDYNVDQQDNAPIRYEDYAGFWWRFLAYIIDSIILGIAGVMINFMLGAAGIRQMETDPREIERVMSGGEWSFPEIYGVTWTEFTITQAVSVLLGWLYFALMESSSRQGTLGKMALGITVTDLEGRRISFARATGRHFAKIISALTLLIGYIMAGFTERKQALHDMIAGTLVLKRQR